MSAFSSQLSAISFRQNQVIREYGETQVPFFSITKKIDPKTFAMNGKYIFRLHAKKLFADC